MTDVAICIPFGDGGRPPELQRRIQQMQNQWPQHTFTYIEVDLQIVGKARNMLLAAALESTPCEVFWYIDRDTFPPLHAGQLVDQALELGIVSGLYFSRRLPYTPQAYMKATESEHAGFYWPLLNYPERGLMLVDAVGGGMVAIRRDIVLSMREYYEERLSNALGRIESLIKHTPEAARDFEWLMRYARHLSPWFEFLDKKGEDLYFCERARDAGHLIWLNVDVKCSHESRIEIVEEHFLHLRDSGTLKVVPLKAPGADQLEVHGAEEQDEDTDLRDAGAKALERSDNLSGTPRRIGIGSDLPGQVPSSIRA